MRFDSLTFLAFLAIVWPLFWILQKKKWRNPLLLLASYIFYGWWDYRFLALIMLSTGIDYVCGWQIFTHRKNNARWSPKKIYLYLSVGANLGVLGFFKYFNFFIYSAEKAAQAIGFHVEWPLWHIVLPVGISFYTFQTMSYTIDIYRGKLTPARRFLDFSLFVAFFPQLVAGPIERAKHLLPQIYKAPKPTKEDFQLGLYLILWGYYKKVVVADRLAVIVNQVYNTPQGENGFLVWVATYAFAFQIYCDFSGYTDIARGVARIMGYRLMENFNLPYFAQSVTEFWRRWHISLSTWLKDYVYIPLGGNRTGCQNRNLMLTMVLGGFWHGASWNFIIWGALQGILLIADKWRKPSPKGKIGAWVAMIVTFHLVCLGWLAFRANSGAHLLQLLKAITQNFSVVPAGWQMLQSLLGAIALLVIYQIFQYKLKDSYFILKTKWPKITFYLILLLSILFFGQVEHQEFIYFQF